MPRYVVQHWYKSDVAEYAAGTTVEMDVETAAWFNRDSLGVLKLIEPPLPVSPEYGKSIDRMIRKAKTRVVRGKG